MWVIEKIRTSAESASFPLPAVDYSFRIGDIMFRDKVSLEKTRKSSPCPNVITPDTIPEFCIPPKIPYQQELRNSRHSDEESTNADPQSQAALSLPHLAKAQTSYGFCTLLESPHTRRKESLFHSDPSSCSIPLAFPRSRSSSYPRVGLNTLTSGLSSRKNSSPFGSPLLQRSPPKSSLPSVIRRSSDGSWELQSSNVGLAPPTIFPMELVIYRDRVVKESLIPLGTGGSLRLSAEYSPENHRLRLRLISADGLYALSVDPKTIGCSVTISLLPGKVQKQRSSIIRKSRNPIFNEDFFFDAISEGDLYHWSVRFKVVNKMPTMKRDYTLGDCDVPLASILSL
uniref:C2 calcium dependent domain containing 4A n=1 Tax=Scleropages formosus TaxID=113540 RepID=A0A8C9W500_SCLFO